MPDIVNTSKAPAKIGPYSHAIRAGNFLFVSGQLPIDPATGNIVGNDIASQTCQVLRNIKSIMIAAGMDVGNLIKVSVYLTNIDDLAAMNEVYQTFIKSCFPARLVVEVSGLIRDALVEIEAVGFKE